MISIIWSELRMWEQVYAQKTLGTVLRFVAVITAISIVRPEMFFSGAIFSGLYLGLLAGKHTWSPAKPWEWTGRGGLPPLLVIGGKIIAVVLICLVHLIVLTPVAILTSALWGIPAWVLAYAVLAILMGAATTSAWAMMGHYLSLGNGSLADLFAVGWFAATLIVPPFRLVNPLWLAWVILNPEKTPLFGKGIIMGLALLFLTIFAIGILMRNERGYPFERR
jgi:MFS family permease